MSMRETGKWDVSLMIRNRAGLVGRQSVRATFRLAEEFIVTLGILSSHLGIRQKSLFDFLLEDTESLEAIVRLERGVELERTGRIPKTFVISRKSLASLERISREMGISRDDVVEYAIVRLLPILRKERRQQKKREDALIRIASGFHGFRKLLDEIEAMVGKEDPMYVFLGEVMGLYRNAFSDMEVMVKKGKKIAELPLDKFKG